MTVGNGRAAKLAAALVVCAAAACMLGSCALFQRRAAAPSAEPLAAAAEAGIAIEAHFLRDGEKAPGFFRKELPDSGYVPVRVTIRNDGTEPLAVHSASGMDLGAGFGGFTLVAGGKEYFPVHPREILDDLVGRKNSSRYRKSTGLNLVVGVALPPVGGYFVFNEASVGRFYRPLFKHSLHPALAAGTLSPVVLEPGVERSGFLYFAMPPALRDSLCELRVAACVPIGTEHAIPGRDFEFSRDEVLLDGTLVGDSRDRGETGSCDAPYGYIYALVGEGKKAKRNLTLCRVSELAPGADSLWNVVASIESKSAAIADVSCRGSLAACAVNFKSKAKVYLIHCGEKPEVYEEHSFSRLVDRVFLCGSGALVVTVDGVCHRYDGMSHRWAGGVKLGRDVGDTALLRGQLFVFGRDEVRVLDASNLNPLARVKEGPLRPGTREMIGPLGDNAALVSRGSAARADSVSLFDIERLGEMTRVPFPGRINRASTIGSDIVLQLESGVLLRVRPAPLGTFETVEAGYLPFAARTLRAAPRGFIAVGSSGELAVGVVDDFRPGTRGAVEVSTPVR